jgi:hypothetical protein
MTAPQSNLSSWTIAQQHHPIRPVHQLYGVSDRDSMVLRSKGARDSVAVQSWIKVIAAQVMPLLFDLQICCRFLAAIALELVLNDLSFVE